MHLVPITYSPIIHHSSNLIPLPSANNPETSNETTKFSTFLEMSMATLGLFWSRSLPVLKETKVNYIFYSPRYQPLTELFGERVFNFFQGCGEECGWSRSWPLQTIPVLRLARSTSSTACWADASTQTGLYCSWRAWLPCFSGICRTNVECQDWRAGDEEGLC